MLTNKKKKTNSAQIIYLMCNALCISMEILNKSNFLKKETHLKLSRKNIKLYWASNVFNILDQDWNTLFLNNIFFIFCY